MLGRAPGLSGEVQVARWSILDGKVVAPAARAKIGDPTTLTLEPMEAHPQLESERLVSDFDGVADAIFLDVTPIERRDLAGAGR